MPTRIVEFVHIDFLVEYKILPVRWNSLASFELWVVEIS